MPHSRSTTDWSILGGDIRIIGPHPSGQPWRIGIRHPRQPDAWMATAEIDSGALATSGDYELRIEIDAKRYGHILHPATGWPVGGLCSVSVIAGNASWPARSARSLC